MARRIAGTALGMARDRRVADRRDLGEAPLVRMRLLAPGAVAGHDPRAALQVDAQHLEAEELGPRGVVRRHVERLVHADRDGRDAAHVQPDVRHLVDRQVDHREPRDVQLLDLQGIEVAHGIDPERIDQQRVDLVQLLDVHRDRRHRLDLPDRVDRHGRDVVDPPDLDGIDIADFLDVYVAHVPSARSGTALDHARR